MPRSAAERAWTLRNRIAAAEQRIATERRRIEAAKAELRDLGAPVPRHAPRPVLGPGNVRYATTGTAARATGSRPDTIYRRCSRRSGGWRFADEEGAADA